MDLVRRALDSDIFYSFRRSPVVVIAAIVTVAFFAGAVFAPLIAPQNPFDLRQLNLMDASLPPMWLPDGMPEYPLGTDTQGRDVFSTILFGSRVSLLVGFLSVVFAMVLGVGLGLVAGYMGGTVDAIIMRVADVQLSFPAILIALLIDGVARIVIPRELHHEIAIYVLILAIGFSGWVQ
ncbi:MAG: ABC transporter permease, partial [Proteobacteria bacterium]|nr:ABC transporter permease [Pseudomonadota bacterium]